MATDQELLATAKTETGLEDFGGDSFRDGLDRLLRSLTAEAQLNSAGESLIYPRLVGHLKNRLHIEDWYRRHPEIDEVEIVRPLFGLSLPRTGSTALSFLLAQDPAIRYLRLWESDRPYPEPPGAGDLTGGAGDPTGDPGDPGAGSTSHGSPSPKIGTKDHVPADVNGPMECLDLLALDFKAQIYLAFAHIPSYAEWLIGTDLTSAYLYERRVLKLLQWGEPERPWRLKSPAHMVWVGDLSNAFPDARFVMTHRDPTDILLSVCDVYADIIGCFTDQVDLAYIGALNLDEWSKGTERLMAFREGAGEGRFYDIDFRAMQSDPIGQVRGLYSWLGEDVSEDFEAAMASWWAANAENREPSGHSEPATYGLDRAQISERFAPYVQAAREWVA